MPAERETFIKLSDHMPEHPKIEGLTDKAFRALIDLWCWCSRSRTDGHIPAGVWGKRAPGKAGRELLSAGLVDKVDGEMWMHDYLKHQRSKEQIEALSEKRAQAGREGGKKRPSTKQDGSNLLSNDEAEPPPEDRGSTTYFPDRDAEQDSSSEIADAIPDQDADDEPPPREDVEELCRHLADRIEANGSKRPRITAKWRDEARLMLDRDGRTVDAAHRAIDWCQDDPFWRSNVLGMPKFRAQYDQMRLRAQQDRERDRGLRSVPTTTARVQGALAHLRPDGDDPQHPPALQLSTGSEP